MMPSWSCNNKAILQSDWLTGISVGIDFQAQESRPKSLDRLSAVIKWQPGAVWGRDYTLLAKYVRIM